MAGVFGDSPVEPLPCPRCLTVGDPNRECMGCGLDFNWATSAELSSALAGHRAANPCRVRLKVGSQCGERTYWCDSNETVEIEFAASSCPLRISVNLLAGQLQVEHGEIRLSLPFPCRSKQVWGLVISAHLALQLGAAPNSPLIEGLLPFEIDLAKPATFGAGVFPKESSFYQLRLGDLSLRQATVLRQPLPGTRDRWSHWAFALRTGAYIWVNGRPHIACELRSGDLIQIGGYAWTLDSDESFQTVDSLLVPIRSIAGARLQAHEITTKFVNQVTGLPQTILRDLNLVIAPGEFVALVGPSGAGKSTLLRALLGDRTARTSGSVGLDDLDSDLNREEFRGQIAYVDQHDDVLHSDLTAEQAVHFAGRLRGRIVTDDLARQTLMRLGLPRSRCDNFIRNLSGGQRKRVQIATALIAGARAILLDEPASGLDTNAEQTLLALLRGLSRQGCTIVMVTHNLHSLPVDTVVHVENGQTTIEHVAGQVPRKSPEVEDSAITPSRPKQQANQQFSFTRRKANQLRWLVARDWRRISQHLGQRIAVSLGLLPFIFALALTVAIPVNHPELFGFFVGLSVIWLSSSLSLNALVGEGRIADHERRTFLDWDCWVAAKWSILAGQSLVQTSMLFFWLKLPGWLMADSVSERFGGNRLVIGNLLSMLLLGMAAVGVGLLLSAIAKVLERGRKESTGEIAVFLLPLFMLVQIVFSVHVAGTERKELVDAYGEYHLGSCVGAIECKRPVNHWSPRRDGSYCTACFLERKQHETDDKVEAGSPAWHARVRKAMKQTPPLPPSSPPAKEALGNWSKTLSYLTLSRYADILLWPESPQTTADIQADSWRSFDRADRQYAERLWKRGSTLRLAGIVVVLPVFTWLVLAAADRLQRSLLAK